MATHEYQCVQCGLRIKGRALPDGRIKATNWPADPGPPRDSLCIRCYEVDR